MTLKKIAIFSVPRSGSSWLGQIFNSHEDVSFRMQPLFSYSHKSALNKNSTDLEIHKFFEEIYKTSDDFVLMRTEITKNYPNFSKSKKSTHIIMKETRYLNIIENILRKCPDVKIIGLVRNPFSTIASWIKAPKEFSKDWDIEEEWYFAPKKNQNKDEEFFGFYQWKKTALNFLEYEKLFPNNFNLIDYKFLNNHTELAIEKLFKFSQLNFSKNTKKFIQASKSRFDYDSYSVYRSNSNDDEWESFLPNSIIKKIRSEISKSPLERFC